MSGAVYFEIIDNSNRHPDLFDILSAVSGSWSCNNGDDSVTSFSGTMVENFSRDLYSVLGPPVPIYFGEEEKGKGK
jgi:hypothetical protein